MFSMAGVSARMPLPISGDKEHSLRRVERDLRTTYRPLR